MSNTRYLVNNSNILDIDYNLLYICNSKFENDWHSTAHFHPFTEIFFIINGKGSFYLNDSTVNVSEGDLILINPNCLHTEKSVYTDEPLEYIVLGIDNFILSLYDTNANILNLNSDKIPTEYTVIKCSNKSKILTYLNCLISEITKKDLHYELSCKNLLTLLIINIMRDTQKRFKSNKDSKNTLNLECMKIKNYIDSNYSQNITLDNLVKLTHLTKYYLVHSFTKHIGISPICYLINKRIDEACNLLLTTNYSVKDISFIVGFSNSSYFSQMFKKITGKAPLTYKKSVENTSH